MNTGELLNFNERTITIGYDSNWSRSLFIDISIVIAILYNCFNAKSIISKKIEIEKLLNIIDWEELYKNKKTNRRILCESSTLEHSHELITAMALTQVNYDVLFAPKGLFNRSDKKFDVFLIRDHVILKADLKCISSKNPDTIANRIKSGSNQATRIVIDINSDIDYKKLIDGLRSGVSKNNLIKEILLFYNHKFYRLSCKIILSKNVYKILK